MAGSAFGGRIRMKQSKKNPARGPGFIVDTLETRATAYPAECRYNGRRARDVMPAAARALVSTVAV
jgi:hypothetical protein